MMRGVRIGELDRRLTIQYASTVTNDPETNNQIKSWTTLATVWGKRLKVSSDETFEARQQVALSRVRYLIRWRSDVTEQMRIIEGNNIYSISGIEDGADRKSTLIITAEKRDNE